MKFNISNNRSGYYLKSKWQLDNDGYVRPLTYDPEKQPSLLSAVASATLPDNNAQAKHINAESLYTHKISTDHTGEIQTNKAKRHLEIKIVNEAKPRIWNGKEYVESDTPDDKQSKSWLRPTCL